MHAAQVRDRLLHALRLDLVGPDPLDPRDAPLAHELLDVPPTHWYLTGFLVPSGTAAEHFADVTAAEGLGTVAAVSSEDGEDDEEGPARRPVFPSSIGVTVLIPPGVDALDLTARWGTYTPVAPPEPIDTELAERGAPHNLRWRREPHEESLRLPLDAATLRKGIVLARSGGVVVRGVIRTLRESERARVPEGSSVLTVFMVNQRAPRESGPEQDVAVIFQAELELRCSEGFVPRPDVRGAELTDDLDARMGDLHYRDAFEYAVGHGVAVRASVQGHGANVFCDTVRSTWIPTALVERVIPSEVPGCELRMDALAAMATSEALRAAVMPMVTHYRRWIERQHAIATTLDTEGRRELANWLLAEASRAADRIEAGIVAMDDSAVLEAFRRANRAMADAARHRSPRRYAPRPKGEGKEPTWRPFQLAFLLMNVASQADPSHPERDVVDLIFFPTGGGKTEAYLGLAAFALVLRRLRHGGFSSGGVTVLMRYTLRLLTLDQLSRAATLVCALELQRREDPARLGPHRFSIGLWVGNAATPNRFGTSPPKDDACAIARVLAFRKNPKGAASPVPLDKCPWCGEPFNQDSFDLQPSLAAPRTLRTRCTHPGCDFRASKRWPEGLPLVTVDEEIYRELPSFLLATVDKFAALPWVGSTGKLLGRHVTHRGPDGFLGPADDHLGATALPAPLLPPDLIIQDELHLISGPLGTMVGLYETALDALATRTVAGRTVRPKIVASTATVRAARTQVRALFARSDVRVFPPPGIDRSSSFFAETLPARRTEHGHPRTYVGVVAPGRSMKVLLLRSYVALLGAAQRAWEEDPAAADPYMTLVGYFNSLRELGGARRIIEDEVRHRVARADRRRRIEGLSGDERLAARSIAYECVELTSRESTDKIKVAKERLSVPFDGRAHAQRPPVDVALASNMISVGLDIERLGLMVVCGQPKTAAEYIQASSRVGREAQRPGLVVTLLNVHRARDRSHFEHFEAFHQSFYRAVEATSVTPFSPRTIDRGLAGVAVALARLAEPSLTPPDGAAAIEAVKTRVGEFVAETLTRRAEAHRSQRDVPADEPLDELTQTLRHKIAALFDAWVHIARDDTRSKGLVYQCHEDDTRQGHPLLHMPLDEALATANKYERKFVAHRSMRDVEAATEIMVMTRKGAAAILAREEGTETP